MITQSRLNQTKSRRMSSRKSLAWRTSSQRWHLNDKSVAHINRVKPKALGVTNPMETASTIRRIGRLNRSKENTIRIAIKMRREGGSPSRITHRFCKTPPQQRF